MSYVLECYNKSRIIDDKYPLNNDGDNSFRLLLGDAFSCVIDCFVLNDTKLVNTFDMNYDAVDWLIVKRDYVDIENDESDNYQSVLKFYVQDNYAKEERYAYLTLTDNLTGESVTFDIKITFQLGTSDEPATKGTVALSESNTKVKVTITGTNLPTDKAK